MNKYKFRLSEVNTVQFAILENFFDKNYAKISIGTNIEFGIKPINNSIIVFTKFQLKHAKNPFIIIETSCVFNIEKNTWNSLEKIDKIILPREFITYLAMVSVGTARGVLHAKTENTMFNQFCLPTINVEKLINADAVFRK